MTFAKVTPVRRCVTSVAEGGVSFGIRARTNNPFFVALSHAREDYKETPRSWRLKPALRYSLAGGWVGSEPRPRTNNPFFVALSHAREDYKETPRSQPKNLVANQALLKRGLARPRLVSNTPDFCRYRRRRQRAVWNLFL